MNNTKNYLEILNSSNPNDYALAENITNTQIENFLLKVIDGSIFKMDFSLFLKFIILTGRTPFFIDLCDKLFFNTGTQLKSNIFNFLGIASLDSELGMLLFYERPYLLTDLLTVQKKLITIIPSISVDNSLMFKQQTLQPSHLNLILDYLFLFHTHFHASNLPVGKVLGDNFYYSYQLLKFIIDQYKYNQHLDLLSLYHTLPDEFILSSLEVLSEWSSPHTPYITPDLLDNHLHRQTTSRLFLISLHNDPRSAATTFKNSLVNLYPYFNFHTAIKKNPELFS